MAKGGKNSWWITLGCGCAVLGLMVIGAVVGGGWFAVSKVRGYAEDLEDPVRRNARASELLGAESLPEGYAAAFYFEIPWVLHFVALGDHESVPGGDPTTGAAESDLAAADTETDSGEANSAESFEREIQSFEELDEGSRRFFYMRFRFEPDEPGFSGGRGRSENSNVSVQMDDLEVRSAEELESGTLELGEQTIRFGLHRGSMEGIHDRQPGLYSALEIDCPGEPNRRYAVWFERREAARDAFPEDLAGTPADLTALRAFLEHFDLCAR